MKNAVTIKANQNVEIYKNNILAYSGKNLVVTAGREWIAERMISDSPPNVMSHMAIGATSGFSADLVTNGDMELDANWNDYGSPTSNVRSAVQYHNGSFSRAFVTPGTGYDGIVSDDFATVTDEDLFVQAWIYPTATTSCYVAVRQGDDDRYLYYERWTGLTAGMWNKVDFSIVELSGGANAHIAFFSDNADTFYVDDVNVYRSVALTETTLMNELSRLPLVSSNRTNNYIEYICDWAAGIGTGAIVEAGIFNDIFIGTMLSRIAFPVINKLVDDSLTINWKVFVSSI